MANSLLDPEYFGDTGNALAGLLSAPKRVSNALIEAYQTMTQPNRFDQVAGDFIMDTPQRFRDNVNSAFPDPRLLNPNNQTPEAQSARESVANALMGFAAPINRADPKKIARALDKMGLEYQRGGSGISQSQYFDIDHPTIPDTNIKVRISDHDYPSYYGAGIRPNVDLYSGSSNYGGRAEHTADSWLEAVKQISDKTGVDVPPYVRSLLNKNALLAISEDQVKLRQKIAAWLNEPKATRGPRPE